MIPHIKDEGAWSQKEGVKQKPHLSTAEREGRREERWGRGDRCTGARAAAGQTNARHVFTWS